MNIFQKIAAVWQKVSIVQRALLAAILLAVVLVGVVTLQWARRPDMRVLYSGLNPEEAARITEKIGEKDINYELRNGGTSIYVPREHVYQLRLDMAKEGLASGDQGGYQIFDNEKIGISPFVQNVNLKRALQDELAKSIQMIDGVEHARVHIVSAEQTLFSSSETPTSASVVLRIKPGYRLGNSNIAAVANLVAGSVEGLKAENVTVVDSNGRLLSGGSDMGVAGGGSTVQDYKERVEQNLAAKAEEMLTLVLGPGRATVKVNAIVDMNSVNLVKETYEPKGVAKKEEIKEKTKTAPVAAGGEDETTTPGKETDNTIVTDYVLGKTVEQRVDLPGEIKSLSVAAVVDLTPADANESAGGATAKIMELTDVERLIQTALGLDVQGRDSLQVVEARFHRPLIREEAESGGGLDYIAIARHSSLGLMAVCALLVLKIFSGAKKKAGAEGAAGQSAEGGAVPGLLPGMPAGSESILVKTQIAEALKNDPQRAKQLFLTWLQEKA